MVSASNLGRAASGVSAMSCASVRSSVASAKKGMAVCGGRRCRLAEDDDVTVDGDDDDQTSSAACPRTPPPAEAAEYEDDGACDGEAYADDRWDGGGGIAAASGCATSASSALVLRCSCSDIASLQYQGGRGVAWRGVAWRGVTRRSVRSIARSSDSVNFQSCNLQPSIQHKMVRDDDDDAAIPRHGSTADQRSSPSAETVKAELQYSTPYNIYCV